MKSLRSAREMRYSPPTSRASNSPVRIQLRTVSGLTCMWSATCCTVSILSSLMGSRLLCFPDFITVNCIWSTIVKLADVNLYEIASKHINIDQIEFNDVKYY